MPSLAAVRRRAPAPVVGVLCLLSIAALPSPAAATTGDPVTEIVGSLVEGVRDATGGERGGCAGADVDPNRGNLRTVRQATLCLLNVERTKRGLQSLRMRPRLQAGADRYSRAMARGNFFAHVTPYGQTMLQRIRATGYVPRHRAWVLGENLGWGTYSMARPSGIVRAWMDSPPHRRNILDPQFREIGVGVTVGAPQAGVPDNGAATYTTHFGALL